MSIDRAEVLRLAELARLQLSPDEIERLSDELGAVLDYFQRIRELDLPESPAEPQAAESTPTRADVPGSDTLERPVDAMAPEWHDGFFVLPRLPGMDAPPGDAGRSDDE